MCYILYSTKTSTKHHVTHRVPASVQKRQKAHPVYNIIIFEVRVVCKFNNEDAHDIENKVLIDYHYLILSDPVLSVYL